VTYTFQLIPQHRRHAGECKQATTSHQPFSRNNDEQARRSRHVRKEPKGPTSATSPEPRLTRRSETPTDRERTTCVPRALVAMCQARNRTDAVTSLSRNDAVSAVRRIALTRARRARRDLRRTRNSFRSTSGFVITSACVCWHDGVLTGPNSRIRGMFRSQPLHAFV
jgi:hypothetical protein